MSVQVWPKATVQEGQPVNLTCLVWTTHLAQLTYTWYQDGQQRPGARSIHLPNVTVTDAASYHCGVVTPGQAPRFSTPVILDVLCEWWRQGGGTAACRDQGVARAPQVSVLGTQYQNSAGRWSTSQGASDWGAVELEQQCPRLGTWKPLGWEARPPCFEGRLHPGLLVAAASELPVPPVLP